MSKGFYESEAEPDVAPAELSGLFRRAFNESVEVQAAAYRKVEVEAARRREQRATDRDAYGPEAEEAYRRLKAQHSARRRIAAEDRAAQPTPAAVTLADLLSEPDDPVVYRLAGLWPCAGRVVLSAPMKSGKTTLTGNLLRSLVDGDPFLGEFVADPVRKVVLIDDEMDREQIKRWLRAQGIRHTKRVRVVSLRGRVSTFDLLDPARRAEWVEVLAGAKVVVLDCLRPVLDSLGLSEDKDAGKFLVAFDALLTEAGVPEALVVHHTGHAGDRSRGDSRIRDWPDVEWRMVRDTDDDSKPRFFRAFGRDVDVPEGRLAYDGQTRHLTYMQGEDRRNTTDDESVRRTLEYVRDNPEATTSAIKEALGGSTAAVNACLKYCRGGLIAVKDGPRRARLHTIAPEGEKWLAEHVVAGKLMVPA